jgi:hypothetical protein
MNEDDRRGARSTHRREGKCMQPKRRTPVRRHKIRHVDNIKMYIKEICYKKVY